MQKSLNHLQRVSCLATSGHMNTTPQAALETLLNLAKLDKYTESEAKNTAYRLRKYITNAQYSMRSTQTYWRNYTIRTETWKLLGIV